MSLDITLTQVVETEVYWGNITHNLSTMARKCGVYEYLWKARDNKVTKASHLITPIQIGLRLLKADPEYYKTFDAENGWGVYPDFVNFLEELLTACKNNPHATISVSV